MKTIIKNVLTRLTEDHDQVATVLTICFGERTMDEVYEIAAQACAIKAQAAMRKLKAIPTSYTYNVPRPGTKSVVIDYGQALVKLFGADVAMKLIKKHGTAEAAYTAIKPLLDTIGEATTEEPKAEAVEETEDPDAPSDAKDIIVER